MKFLFPYLARRRDAFAYAFAGLFHVLRTQAHARIHAAITLAVLILGAWLGLSRIEWALIVVCIGAVWAAEILNTALEAVVDIVAPQPHPLAKIAKDCAAGAVLVTALLAAIVGLLLLGPPLWDRTATFLGL